MPTAVVLNHEDKLRLKEAIIAVHRDNMPRRNAIAQYNISGRRLSTAITNIEEHEKLKDEKLIGNEKQK